MKRTQEKIKDIVEPQAFDEVRNVASDPARSVAAYRFTDATSDLLARWLDALADLPRGRGAARALAGARGVGKTHTLAVFGALAGQDALRQSVSDAHVATSARRLSGRRYTAVRVERGTRTTLAEETAFALTKALGGSEAQWGTDPAEMIRAAAARMGDATLVVVIDTSFERPTRVRRDDGPVLAEVAAAAQDANAFIALALDDDISGADGPNVAIAGSYKIDYLDHEHLLRVADTYILRKNDQARAALHDIYLHLRSTVPSFNWSEPRFASLYPVHPLVAEVSASVRLYAPGFAFLPFAASAARQATSRPALSLVLLDEVFDRAERDLRRSTELEVAFEIYDDLATRGVAQFPAMQRLEARLILKSLFILSLDGGGATARALCGALLVGDEQSPEAAVARVREVLARFAETAAADSLRVTSEASDGGEARYCLQISASDKFKSALDKSAARLLDDGAAALAQLGAGARPRFEDWPFAEVRAGESRSANLAFLWRGSERHARLTLQGAGARAEKTTPHDCELEVVILAPGAGEDEASSLTLGQSGDDAGAQVFAAWVPSEPSAEELSALRRLHALRTDAALAESFGEAARAAALTLTAQAERAWARAYLSDGALFVGGRRLTFNERALEARTLASALAETFDAHLTDLYPQHPQFAEVLTDADAARLVAGFFAGGAAKADADVQRLALAFALPLGLAELRDGECVFSSDEGHDPAWVREVFTLTGDAEAAAVVAPIDTVRRALARPPYGLQREAQNLVLCALVAQRRVELVTGVGERVERRGLSQPLKWDAVAGVALASSGRMGAEELIAWARLLTGNPALPPLGGEVARDAAHAALAAWLERWEQRRLSRESFDALPEAARTRRVWKMSASVEKCFGAAAAAVGEALAGGLSLEEGLERVADAFDGSTERLECVERDLDALTQLMENVGPRESARAYLLAAEPTGDDATETVRRELLSIAADRESLFDATQNERFDRLWREFLTRYTEIYAAAHDASVGSGCARGAVAALLADNRWREFEGLSRLAVVGRRFWETAERLIRRAEMPRCDLPARALLATQPACACGFTLRRAEDLSRLPSELEELIEAGLASYRRTLALVAKPLQRSLETLAARDGEKRETATRARILAAAFAQGALPPHFSRTDAHLIERALEGFDATTPLRVPPPAEDFGLLTRDELASRLRQWVDELPAHATLVELAANGDGIA
jgi:hypothetical protein